MTKNSHIALDSLISLATKQNWRRLGIIDRLDNKSIATFYDLKTKKENLKNPTHSINQHPKSHTTKLTTRANKKLSTKFIIPTEYFCNSQNIAKIQGIVEYISLKNYTISNALYSLALNLLENKISLTSHTPKRF